MPKDTHEKLNILTAFKDAGQLYLNNFQMLLSISSVVLLTSLIVYTFTTIANPNIEFFKFIFKTLDTLLSIWIEIALIHTVVMLLKQEKVSILKMLIIPRHQYLRVLGVNLGLGFMIGFPFLIGALSTVGLSVSYGHKFDLLIWCYFHDTHCIFVHQIPIRNSKRRLGE